MILNIVAIILLSFILFVDDTNIFYSNSCLKSLNKVIQEEVNKVAEWLNSNKLYKLSLNIKKTKCIIIRSTNKKLQQDVKVSVNNVNIEHVKCTTFLGVTTA